MQSSGDIKNRFVKSLLAVTVTASLPVLAQQQRVLEEIVVTAEHREASLQETQISISAFSADIISELGISNGLDIGQFVPNLNAQPYVGGRAGVSFNIRGIGNAETLVSGDPAVSVYIDGVLIAKNTGSLLDVLELERIEVLRGPQGTLYGRNTMGGAVNYITQKPGDVLGGKIKATLGKFGQRDLRGMVNVPLLDASSAAGALNMRLAAATLNRDGITDNDLAGAPDEELGTKDREVALLHLGWQPLDALSVTYSYDRTRIDEHPESPFTTNANMNRFFGRQVVPFVERESKRPTSGQFNDPHNSELDVDGHALNIGWDLAPNMTLHSITGYREMENFSRADSDGTPLPLIFTRDLQEYDSFSQEFRLVGTAVDDRLDYSVGLFYMEEEGDLFNDTVVLGGSRVNVAHFKNDTWAVYGQFTYSFTEQLDATFGIRYTEEDREMQKAAIFGENFESAPFLNDIRQTHPDTVFPKASKKFDNLSPMASVNYQWTDDVMTYFKVATGFQSGGVNARDTTAVDFQTGFDEETIVSYELGLKSVFDGRYQLNAAAFFSDYDDKRVNQINLETLASVLRNAGKVEIWGVELELLAQLTDRVEAGLNYGHVYHEFVEYDFVNPDGSVSDLTDSANFPYSPRNTASAHLAYQYPLGFGTFRARTDWSYRDNMTFLVPKPETNSSGPVQLWNARVSLDDMAGPGDATLRLSLWGKNLTDEGYWNFGVGLFNSFGFDINTYGEPRTFGVDLELKF